MVELIVGTYGVLCWLLFAKFKVVPVNTYTVVTAFLGGGLILLLLYIFLSVFHPVSHDGRMYAPVVQIVPNVRGTVVEVPVEANRPVKKGDVLFRIDRQAREAHEQALSRVEQVKKRRDLSKSQYDRVATLGKSLSVAQEEVDRIQAKWLGDEEEYRQASAEEKIAAERLKSGSGSLESARQEVAAAE